MIKDELDMEDFLKAAIGDRASEEGVKAGIRTFADAGLGDSNAGLVVKLDGAEYQITIVRSR